MEMFRFIGCVVAALFLTACGDWRTESEYIISSDGHYVVELMESTGPLSIGSIKYYVNIGTPEQRRAGKLTQVFYGLNTIKPIVYWSSPYTVMILFCDGRIKELDSTYYDKPEEVEISKYTPKVYIQVITAPNVNIDNQKVCEFDPATGWWTEEGLQKYSELEEYWRLKRVRKSKEQ